MRQLLLLVSMVIAIPAMADSTSLADSEDVISQFPRKDINFVLLQDMPLQKSSPSLLFQSGQRITTKQISKKLPYCSLSVESPFSTDAEIALHTGFFGYLKGGSEGVSGLNYLVYSTVRTELYMYFFGSDGIKNIGSDTLSRISVMAKSPAPMRASLADQMKATNPDMAANMQGYRVLAVLCHNFKTKPRVSDLHTIFGEEVDFQHTPPPPAPKAQPEAVLRQEEHL